MTITELVEKNHAAMVVAILRGAGKRFYIKESLRAAAPSIPLYGDEVVADAHCAKPFKVDA